MTCCRKHWREITDPQSAADPCRLCALEKVTEALREISTPPGPEYGDHRQRLAFVVSVVKLVLAELEWGDSEEGEHRPPENDAS
jgi:hypothetical protein